MFIKRIDLYDDDDDDNDDDDDGGDGGGDYYGDDGRFLPAILRLRDTEHTATPKRLIN